MYQMVITYPKCPQNIPNSHKIYQHFPVQGPPKITQIGIFGLKITIWQPRVTVGKVKNPFQSAFFGWKSFHENGLTNRASIRVRV
jgi:hypothetical protein